MRNNICLGMVGILSKVLTLLRSTLLRISQQFNDYSIKSLMRELN